MLYKLQFLYDVAEIVIGYRYGSVHGARQELKKYFNIFDCFMEIMGQVKSPAACPTGQVNYG